MKVWIGIVLFLLTAGSLPAEGTNLVEILRQFQAQLDAREGKVPLESLPVVAKEAETVAPTVAPPEAATESGVVSPTVEVPVPVGTSVLSDSSERRLRSGDVLRVEVLDEPDMSTNRVMVSETGQVRMPMLGEVKVGGKTVTESTEMIRAALGRDYLVNPRVRVMLVEEAWPAAIVVAQAPPVEAVAETVPVAAEAPRSGAGSFTIGGMVRNPGSYSWPSGQQVSLLRAIGMAGGTAPHADTTRLTIRRVVDGKKREIVYDLRLMRGESAEPVPMLEPGDEVEVPRD